MEIKFNVKPGYMAYDLAHRMAGWELFDALGKRIGQQAWVTSPDMLNHTHHKQTMRTYDLYKLRKAGATATHTISQRRGYIAVIFEISK